MASLRTHTVYNILEKKEDDESVLFDVENEGKRIMIQFGKKGKILGCIFERYVTNVMAQRGNKYIFFTHAGELHMNRYYFLTIEENTIDVWTYVLPSFDSPHFGAHDANAPYSFQTFLTNSWAPL